MLTTLADRSCPRPLGVLVVGEAPERGLVEGLLEALPGFFACRLDPGGASPWPRAGGIGCVVLAAARDPEPGAVHALGVLAYALAVPALVVLSEPSDVVARRLVAAGACDVLTLSTLTPELLRQVVERGALRHARARDVERTSRRAGLTGDIVAALASARTRAEIMTVLTDGLLALGALSARVWEAEAGAYQPMGGPGAEQAPAHEGPPRAENEHQAAAAALLGHATWHGVGAGEGGEPAACGYLPVREPGRAPSVVSLACESVPGEADRAAMEELAVQAEAALERLAALEAQRAQLVAYQRLLGEVSRDLRDPLTTLRVGAQLLGERADSEVARGLARLARAASVASRVVDDLRGFAEGHGEVVIDPALGDLYELLTAVVSDARARFGPRRCIALELPAEPGTCSFDLPRMEQAFGNLIAYALTHSLPGTGLVVRASGDEHALYIEVESAVHDALSSALPTLLDLDVRAASVAAYGSGGIGLFVAARIVDAHRGRVWVEARRERVSALCVQLPRRGATKRPAQVTRLRLLPPMPDRASSPPPLSGTLLALGRTMRAEALRSALALWNAARGPHALPHLLSLSRRALLPLLPDMVIVAVAELDGEVCFRIEELGARLERRLGGTTRGERVAPTLDALATSQHAAYRRCWEIRGPAYDYVRQRGPDGWLMERLLVPLSRDGGKSVHQLAGFIVFSGGGA